MDDDAFLLQFEDCSWPLDQWHHREHVKIAYLYLRRFPFDAALEQLRRCLKAYNAAHQVPETLERGYHETLTQAWMRLVHFTLCEYGPCETADQFFDEHPQLWQMKVLRFFYSHDRLMSPHAKASFIEPDLAPFPCSKQAQTLMTQ